MGVDVDVGPSSKQIMAARERYKEWSRDDHMQTRVINYVSKDISEMLPRWDNDEPDVPAKNIVNVMFGAIGSGPKIDVQSKDIKLLGDKMEVVEKKVGINKKGIASNDLQLTV
ncbi:BnaA10g06800D [Brassica napus]|uniref:BnaA10g06800D protein n=1 Tax=Brassica napus TaxID=3708 RepID=A0A078FIV8_BRANA|nr:BnaA10g06800D [Brassica napus]